MIAEVGKAVVSQRRYGAGDSGIFTFGRCLGTIWSFGTCSLFRRGDCGAGGFLGHYERGNDFFVQQKPPAVFFQKKIGQTFFSKKDIFF